MFPPSVQAHIPARRGSLALLPRRTAVACQLSRRRKSCRRHGRARLAPTSPSFECRRVHRAPDASSATTSLDGSNFVVMHGCRRDYYKFLYHPDVAQDWCRGGSVNRVSVLGIRRTRYRFSVEITLPRVGHAGRFVRRLQRRADGSSQFRRRGNRHVHIIGFATPAAAGACRIDPGPFPVRVLVFGVTARRNGVPCAWPQTAAASTRL